MSELEESVEGAGGGCADCFAKQVAAREVAIANGEEPKPFCDVAAKMQRMLDTSLSEARGAASPVSLPDITGKATG